METITHLRQLVGELYEAEHERTHWVYLSNRDSSLWSTTKREAYDAGRVWAQCCDAVERCAQTLVQDGTANADQIDALLPRNMHVVRAEHCPCMRNGVAYTGPEFYDQPYTYQPGDVVCNPTQPAQ